MIFHTRSTYDAGSIYEKENQLTLRDDDLDFALFSLRLAETTIWCKPRIDITKPETCLRSPVLRPSVWPPPQEIFACHSFPIEQRSKLLAGDPSALIDNPSQLNGGQLLLFYLDMCTYEGAVRAHSRGYIGEVEEPPWDTWVHCGTGTLSTAHEQHAVTYLLSWVPTEFVRLVDDSFRVLTLSWLDWVERTEPPL